MPIKFVVDEILLADSNVTRLLYCFIIIYIWLIDFYLNWLEVYVQFYVLELIVQFMEFTNLCK